MSGRCPACDQPDVRTLQASLELALREKAEALAECRRLRLALESTAQSFDDLVARAWLAATGDDCEGPANTGELITTLERLRAPQSRCGVCRREHCACRCDAEGAALDRETGWDANGREVEP